MDHYLDSVRALETKIQAAPFPAACNVPARPAPITPPNTPPDYDRNAHADIMIDLVVMALTCDVTRVISFMLDDSRSDFVYDFLPLRRFTTTGSTPSTGTAPSPHGAINAGSNNDGYATINLWFVEKLARLCQKLQAAPSGAGNLLDAATVWFGSEMHGSNQDALDLPIVTVGGGGGRLKTNAFIDFAETDRKTERLANLHLTLLRRVFDVSVDTFGTAPAGISSTQPQFPNTYGAGTSVIPEILA